MNPRLSIVPLVLILCSGATAAAQPGTVYRGHLAPDALPTGTTRARLTRLERRDFPTLPPAFRSVISVYRADIEWPAAGRDGKLAVVVGQRQAGNAFACADLNGDGKYVPAECSVFLPGKQEAANDLHVGFSVSARVGPFRRLPLVLTLSPPSDAGLTLNFSGAVYASGHVNIAGKDTLLELGVSLSQGGLIDPRNTSIGLDGNGNGKIDSMGVALEFTFTENEEVVFKVGERYLRVKEVDAATRTVILEERPASEYLLIDRVIGAVLPDFEFTDFDGNARRLSDFAGRYVLLDFWGTWCGPCLAEIPSLKAAYESLHGRGLEVLGIDYEHQDPSPAGLAAALEKARSLVASRAIPWPQATPASSKELVRRRFRVQGFPTHLLVGPDRRLLSVGADGSLRGDALLPTLEAIIPRH